MRRVVFDDNLAALQTLPAACAALVYIDPPFNTGRAQSRIQLRTERDEEGDRRGFQGKRYRSIALGRRQFDDQFDDYLNFLEPRLREARRILKPKGAFFLHIDYRESHYCKVLLDEIFGRASFMNEIIWAYDYGGRSKRRWPAKHDTIFWYAVNPDDYTFHYEEMERIPYMAPGLVSAEKAARGKTPTDVWWHTIVGTNSREKTGYPAQKPHGILERIVKVHSSPGDLVVDFFAGTGTMGEAAARLGRQFWLCDDNPQAIEVMKVRLTKYGTEFVNCDEISVDIETQGPLFSE